MSVCLRLAAVAPLRAARFSPCPRGTSEKWHRGLCLLAKAKQDLAGISPGSFSGEAEQTSPGEGWGCDTLLLGVLGAPRERQQLGKGWSLLSEEEVLVSWCVPAGKRFWSAPRAGARLPGRGSRWLAAEGELVAFGAPFSALLSVYLVNSCPSLFQMVTRTKKIFVGGLSVNTTVEDVKQYFEQFGKVRLSSGVGSKLLLLGQTGVF